MLTNFFGWKDGKELWLSHMFLAEVWLDVRVGVWGERGGLKLLSPYFYYVFVRKYQTLI